MSELTATFTPGPWETSRDAVPDWHTQITVYAEDGERVATVFRTEANARLIAAAPTLYEALGAILTGAVPDRDERVLEPTVYSLTPSLIERARAALDGAA